MKEKCIRCGRETEYEVSTPVTIRRYFIEGSGQLCEECYFTIYPVAGALESMSDTNISQSVENESGGSEPPSLESMYRAGVGERDNYPQSVDMTSQYSTEQKTTLTP